MLHFFLSLSDWITSCVRRLWPSSLKHLWFQWYSLWCRSHILLVRLLNLILFSVCNKSKIILEQLSSFVCRFLKISCNIFLTSFTNIGKNRNIYWAQQNTTTIYNSSYRIIIIIWMNDTKVIVWLRYFIPAYLSLSIGLTGMQTCLSKVVNHCKWHHRDISIGLWTGELITEMQHNVTEIMWEIC